MAGKKIQFEEYEIIVGEDVAVPNHYNCVLKPDGSLEGTFVDSVQEQGSLRLSNTYHPPAVVPKDHFRTQSQWYLLAQLTLAFLLFAFSLAHIIFLSLSYTNTHTHTHHILSHTHKQITQATREDLSLCVSLSLIFTHSYTHTDDDKHNTIFYHYIRKKRA